MKHSAINHILYQLKACQAKSLLAASNTLPDEIHDWAKQNQCAIKTIDTSSSLDSLGRFDFVIVADYLETFDKKIAIQRLAQMRNLLGSKIWVQASKAADLSFNDFISLGFKRLHMDDEDKTSGDELTYFGFDLASYNHKRSWNNSKYWANPENWNKFRW